MARIALDTVKAPTSIMIDCSHANSSKDPSRQPDVLDDVLGQIEDGADAIHAVMVESHLKSEVRLFHGPQISSIMGFPSPMAVSTGRRLRLAFAGLPM